MRFRVLCALLAVSLALAIFGAYGVTHGFEFQKAPRYHQHMQAAEKPDCAHGDDTFCTHLPLICIDTGGIEIPGRAYIDQNGEEQRVTGENGETQVQATIRIFDSATQNNHPDDVAGDTGTANVKVRGNSSRYHDKLGYTLTFVNALGENESHAVMGMDAHHEWIMHGPYLDKSLIRNYMWYNIAGEIMDYAPNVRFCEAFLNGEYIGLYVMTESITAGQQRGSRLNLTVDKKDNSFTGYCIRLDRGGNPLKQLHTFTNYTSRNALVYDIVYPGTSNLSGEMKRKIEQDFSYFERILYSFDYSSDTYGYQSMIDTQSFVDYFIINEVTCNYDAGWLSTYVYKDVDGVFRMCIWDFNSACDNYQTPMDRNEFDMLMQPWYLMLTKDADFVEAIIDRYRELREGYLSDEYLNDYIDGTIAYLGDAIDRNFEKWGYTFAPEKDQLTPVDRNPRTHAEAVMDIKTFLAERTAWLDENINSLMQFASDSRNKKFNEAK